MFVIGMLHSAHGDRPLVTAMLHGVAAAAVGLVAAVSVQIGRKVLTRMDDLVFVALAVVGVNVFHLSVLVVLAGLGAAGHLVAPAARRGAGTSTDDEPAPALVGVFAYLSLLTVGGGLAAFPELKTLTVERFHWLSSQQLIHLYSLSQVAPGPNMMMVAAVGERVARVAGALLVVIAFFGPTGWLTLWTGRLWLRLEGWRWRASIQRGLAARVHRAARGGSHQPGQGRPHGMDRGDHRRGGVRPPPRHEDQPSPPRPLRRGGGPVRFRRPLTRETRACAWASRPITADFT